ncbi:tyrosine-type recombinase/integrase [Serratia rubidaea]|uniref:tyrosine-type recombinase/integrase n=1 Tax=Serratia rubidaea TaxID=61652 RepID=UPI001F1B19B4|nr:tyrosine-type recombinase/integrase [Serratia rubidaea]UJD80077.1 tyrosine-type recombinase/integrase [Serratia rubidaea]UJD84633.1 tyrosine-type recombinase/integrase [Serratia rubidaea]HDJ1439749.1 phage integrase Arm DNA-binding domain-containing protein [Serratia rubidaea]HDJ1447231.1 phage integrase Arm DNA-binding domain-containing protein [Serratia rubidaea]HDJ1463793.1 phage integrase Arm DNA-binding domain-containing protein [Serratia rubidaea]
MTRRKGRYDMQLPKNLTYRQKSKSFYWRNPITKKEISMGAISRRDAIAQAIEANHYIDQNYSPALLLEKIKGTHEYTLNNWLERYYILFERRNLSAKTRRFRRQQFAVISEKMGSMILSKITTRHIAEFLEIWVKQEKKTMAAAMRTVLSDIFREAIVEGHIESNPVTPTRSAKPVIKRERLELKQYIPIREAADTLPAWLSLAMDLALVTGQRRADIAKMRFDHVVNGRLLIEQDKTGAMIALPLNLELQAVGLQLGAVIDRCRQVSKTDYMISAGVRKNSPDGAISLNSLTGKFAIARKLTGIEFEASPPPFHEIRSLSGRLYEKEKGKDFAQKLLGHKSGVMTEKYLDARRKEYVML